MLILLVAFVLVVGFLISLLAYAISLRIFGIKLGSNHLFKLTAAVFGFGAILTLLSYLIQNDSLGVVLGLISLIGGFILWHQLLNSYSLVGVGKSLGAYLVAGILGGIVSLLLAIIALGYIQSFQIQGNTMTPTLHDGDVVLGYKHNKSYKFGDPIIYDYSLNGKSGRAIGRVQGVPGQTVRPEAGYVGVDGSAGNSPEYTLNADEYYVVGDNRSHAIPRIIKSDAIVAVIGPTIRKAE
ncbi:MAG TPA: S26 family signal peptidase [Candidatus Limnocylindrales bacterium]|nr:S26 family signal peptidase [Candidatus Limnocylindrales bacterium]